MIYISAYQLIQKNIEGNTAWGQRLLDAKLNKEISINTQVTDEFKELEYSPVHFRQDLVMDLINETIREQRGDQMYIILEGLCNSEKLVNQNDKLELRFMDEFQNIEKNIGQVAGVISLQYSYEQEVIDASEVLKVQFEIEPPKPVAPLGEEVPEGEVEEVEVKVPPFQPEKFEWTITNKLSKNMPMLFTLSKGATNVLHEVKASESFAPAQYEGISKSLDEFCQKIKDQKTSEF